MGNQTLPSPLRRSRAEKHSEKTGRSGVGDLLRYPPFQNVLVLYGSEYIFCSICYLLIFAVTNSITYSWEAIYPLFAFTNTSLGGLQLSVRSPSHQGRTADQLSSFFRPRRSVLSLPSPLFCQSSKPSSYILSFIAPYQKTCTFDCVREVSDVCVWPLKVRR